MLAKAGKLPMANPKACRFVAGNPEPQNHPSAAFRSIPNPCRSSSRCRSLGLMHLPLFIVPSPDTCPFLSCSSSSNKCASANPSLCAPVAQAAPLHLRNSVHRVGVQPRCEGVQLEELVHGTSTRRPHERVEGKRPQPQA